MLQQAGVLFGTDPELFLQTGGKVVGAEKVIPEQGLKVGGSSQGASYGGGHEIVLDGVQVELHLNPSWCRAHLTNEMRLHFQTLRDHLQKMKGTNVSFEAVVHVDPVELASLSDKSRALGCAPSFNLYNREATINVNPATYTTRSAGGHLHFGLIPGSNYLGGHGMSGLVYDPQNGIDQRERVVPILDILVGNTSVLLDRNPLAAERRKVYGRAGEYRTPKYGLEYRTLSNFWIRANPLMCLMMGLGRMAVSVVSTTLGAKQKLPGYLGDPEKRLLRMVDIQKVQKAINENDLNLAKENWKGARQFILEEVDRSESMGVCRSTMAEFDYFLKLVEERGLEYWFPQDPIEHWCSHGEGHGTGFESWLRRTVLPQYKQSMI